MAEKRTHKRIALRSIVEYGIENPHENVSFITDLSDTGVCIKTNKVYRPGTKVEMIFEMDDASYNAKGVVMWAKIVPPSLVRIVKNGMGIRFTEADKGLINIYTSRKDG